MPLMVRRGYDRWLSRDTVTAELLKLVATDASTLLCYPLNPIVSSAHNDDLRRVEHAEW